MTYLAKLKLRSNTSGPIHAESLFMQADADGDGVAFLTTETFLTDRGRCGQTWRAEIYTKAVIGQKVRFKNYKTRWNE
jgi:hypothetical protein